MISAVMIICAQLKSKRYTDMYGHIMSKRKAQKNYCLVFTVRVFRLDSRCRQIKTTMCMCVTGRVWC